MSEVGSASRSPDPLELALGLVGGLFVAQLRNRRIIEGFTVGALDLELVDADGGPVSAVRALAEQGLDTAVTTPVGAAPDLERFRRGPTRLRSLVVEVELPVLAAHLQSGLDRLASSEGAVRGLAIQPEGAGLSLEGEIGTAAASAPFAASLALAPGDPGEVRLVFGDFIELGPTPVPALCLVEHLAQVIRRLASPDPVAEGADAGALGPFLKRSGPSSLRLEPLEPFLARLLGPAGFALPEHRAAPIRKIELLPSGRLRLCAGDLSALELSEGDAAPVQSEAALAREEAAQPVLEASLLAVRGVLAPAFQQLRARLDAGFGPDVIAERALSIGTAEPTTRAEAGTLAADILARRPDSVPALLARARLASTADPRAAFELFERAARMLKEAGRRRAAGLAFVAASRHAPLRGRDRVRALEEAIAILPDSVPALRGLVEELPLVGRASAAVRAARRLAHLAETVPDRAAAHVAAGDLLRGPLGDPSQAKREYERALKLAPEDQGALEGLARAALEQGEPRRAAVLFERAIARAEAEGQTDRAAALLVTLGDLWRPIDPQAAIERYRHAASLEPPRLAAYARLAAAAVEAGRADLACEALDRALPLIDAYQRERERERGPATAPRHRPGAEDGASTAALRAEPGSSRPRADAAADDVDLLDLRLRAGAILGARSDRLEDAVAQYEAALTLDPRSTTALVALAALYERRGDRARRAEVLGRHAIVLAEGGDLDSAAELLRLKAKLVGRDRSALEGVREDVLAVLAREPRHRAVLDALVDVAERENDPQLVVEAIDRRLLAEDPPRLRAQLLLRLGQALLRAGRASDAARALEEALAHDPRDAQAIEALTIIYRENGDEDRLARSLERAAGIAAAAEERARLFAERARLLVGAGREVEAFEALARSLAEHPAAREQLVLATQLALRLGRYGEARELALRRLALETEREAQLAIRLDLIRAAEGLGEKDALIDALAGALDIADLSTDTGRQLSARLARELLVTNRLGELAALERRRAAEPGLAAFDRAERLLEAAKLELRLGQDRQAEDDARVALLALEGSPPAKDEQKDLVTPILDVLEHVGRKRGDPRALAEVIGRRARVVKSSREKERLRLEQARTLERAALDQLALDALEEAAVDLPGSVEIARALGAAAETAGKLPLAASSYGRAAQLAENSGQNDLAIEMYGRAASASAAANELPQAIAYDQGLLSLLGPGSPSAYAQRSIERLERHARATRDHLLYVEVLSRKAAVAPPSLAARFLLEKATIEIELLRAERSALDSLRRARAVAPPGTEVAEQIDALLLELLDRLDLTSELALVLVERAERAPDADRQSALYLRAAEVFVQAGDRGMALSRAQAAIRAAPHNEAARNLRLTLLRDGGRREALVEALADEAAAARNPVDAARLWAEAAATLLPDAARVGEVGVERPNRGDLERGLELVRRATAAMPNAPEPLRAAALYARLLGRPGDELAALDQLADRDVVPAERGAAHLRCVELYALVLDGEAEAQSELGVALAVLEGISPDEQHTVLTYLPPETIQRLELSADGLARSVLRFGLKLTEARGDWPAHVRWLMQLVDQADDPDARADLRTRAGEVLEWKLGDGVAAEREYRAALALQPDHARARAALSSFYIGLDRFADLAENLGVDALRKVWEAMRNVEAPSRVIALAEAFWPALPAGSDERAEVQLTLADLYISEQHDPAKAVHVLEEVTKTAPFVQGTRALERLAVLFLEQERFDLHVDVLRRQAERLGDDRARAQALSDLGDALEWKLGDGQAAEQEYRAALASDPSCESARRRLGVLLASQDRFLELGRDLGTPALSEELERILTRGARERERSWRAAEALARMLSGPERGTMWLHFAERIRGTPGERSALERASREGGPSQLAALDRLVAILEVADDRRALANALRQRVELETSREARVDLHFQLGTLLESMIRSAEGAAREAFEAEAEKELLAVLALEPGHPGTRVLVESLYVDQARLLDVGRTLGLDALRAMKRRAEPREHGPLYQQILEALAQLTEGEERSQCLVQLVEFALPGPKVEKLYRAALDAHPPSIQAREGLRALYEMEGRYQEIAAVLGVRALRDTFEQLKQVYDRQGQLAAASALVEALSRENGDRNERAALHLEIAALRLAEQDSTGAEAALRETLALDPGNPVAREEIRQLLVGQSRLAELAAVDEALVSLTGTMAAQAGDAALEAKVLRALADRRTGQARADLLVQLAAIELRRREVRPAEAVLREALAAAPAHPLARAELEAILWFERRDAELVELLGPESLLARAERLADEAPERVLEGLATTLPLLPKPLAAQALEIAGSISRPDGAEADPPNVSLANVSLANVSLANGSLANGSPPGIPARAVLGVASPVLDLPLAAGDGAGARPASVRDLARRLADLVQARRIWDELGNPEGMERVRLAIVWLLRAQGDFEPLLEALADAGDHVRAPQVRADLALERAGLLIGAGRPEEARALVGPIADDASLPAEIRANACRTLIDDLGLGEAYRHGRAAPRARAPGEPAAGKAIRPVADGVALGAGVIASETGDLGPDPGELAQAARALELLALGPGAFAFPASRYRWLVQLASVRDAQGADGEDVAAPLEEALAATDEPTSRLAVRRRLREIYEQLGDWQRAELHATVIAEADDGAELWVSLAELRLWLDDRSGARAALERALDRDPSSPAAHRAMLHLAEQSGEKQTVIEQLASWAEADREGSRQERAERLMQAARLAAEAGQGDRAAMLVERAVDLVGRMGAPAEALVVEACDLLEPLGEREAIVTVLARVIGHASPSSRVVELRMRLADMLIALGRVAEATTVIEQGLHRGTLEDDPLLLRVIAEVAALPDDAAARRLLGLAERLGSGRAARRLRLEGAERAERAGMLDAADSAWTVLATELRFGDEGVRARRARLRIARRVGDPSKLVGALIDAAEDAASSAERASLLGEAAERAHGALADGERAESLLRRAVAADPANAVLEARLVALLEAEGRWGALDEALEARTAGLRGAALAEALTRQAENARDHLQDLRRAAELFQRAYLAEGDLPRGRAAVELLLRTERHAEAARLAEQVARERCGGDPGARAALLTLRARALDVEGEIDQAIAALSEAERYAPAPALIRRELAELLARHERWQPLAAVLERIADGQEQAEAMVTLLAAARVLCERAADTAAAERLLVSAMKLAPAWFGDPNAAPLAELAELAQAIGAHALAVDALRFRAQSLPVGPVQWRALIALAAAERASGDLDAAEFTLRGVLEAVHDAPDLESAEQLAAEHALGRLLLARAAQSWSNTGDSGSALGGPSAPGLGSRAEGQEATFVSEAVTALRRARDLGRTGATAAAEAELLRDLAEAERLVGRPGEALVALLEARALDPASVSEVELEQAVEAAGPSLRLAELRMARAARAVEPVERARLYLEAAELWGQLGESGRALDARVLAYRLEPFSRAEAERIQEQLYRAERWSDLATHLAKRLAVEDLTDGERVALVVARSRIQAQRLGRGREAIEELAAARDLIPKNRDLLAAMIELAEQLGLDDVRQETLGRLASLAPSPGLREDALAQRAQVLERMGDLDGAAECLEDAIDSALKRRRPARPWVERLARIHQTRGQHAASARIWAQAAEIAPPSEAAACLSRAGHLRLEALGDRRGAMAALEAAARRAEGDLGIRRALIELARALGDLAKARTHAQMAAVAARRAAETDAQVSFVLEEARLAEAVGDRPGALASWRFLIETRPDHPALLDELVARCELGLEAGKVVELLAARVAALPPGPTRARHRLARAKLLDVPLGRSAEAEEERRAAAVEASLPPDRGEVPRPASGPGFGLDPGRRGASRAEPPAGAQRPDGPRAEAGFVPPLVSLEEKAAALEDPAERAGVLVEIGRLHLEQRSRADAPGGARASRGLEGARDAFTRALAVHPENVEALSRLARLEIEAEAWSQAAPVFERLEAIGGPAWAVPSFELLGAEVAAHTGRTGVRCARLIRATQRDPSALEALRGLAELGADRGDAAGAAWVAAYEAALDPHTDRAERARLCERSATALAGRGERGEALALVAQALEIDPRRSGARALERKLLEEQAPSRYAIDALVEAARERAPRPALELLSRALDMAEVIGDGRRSAAIARKLLDLCGNDEIVLRKLARLYGAPSRRPPSAGRPSGAPPRSGEDGGRERDRPDGPALLEVATRLGGVEALGGLEGEAKLELARACLAADRARDAAILLASFLPPAVDRDAARRGGLDAFADAVARALVRSDETAAVWGGEVHGAMALRAPAVRARLRSLVSQLQEDPEVRAKLIRLLEGLHALLPAEREIAERLAGLLGEGRAARTADLLRGLLAAEPYTIGLLRTLKRVLIGGGEPAGAEGPESLLRLLAAEDARTARVAPMSRIVCRPPAATLDARLFPVELKGDLGQLLRASAEALAVVLPQPPRVLSRRTEAAADPRAADVVEDVERATERHLAVLVDPSVGSRVVLEPGDPAAVVIGEALLDDATPEELRFHLARAFVLAELGYLLVERTRGGERKAMLEVALAAADPQGGGRAPVDLRPAVEQVRARLDTAPGTRAQVEALAGRLRGQPLELCGWMSAAVSAANRFALLVAGDLEAAARAVRRADPRALAERFDTTEARAAALERSPVLTDLVTFVLSEDYIVLAREGRAAEPATPRF